MEKISVSLEFPMIHWGDNLSVGIPKVDEQHKKLIDFYNKLVALGEVDGEGKVNVALTLLSNYAKYHFLEEQDILNKKEFPYQYKEFHEEEHALFIKQIEKFLAEKIEDKIHIHELLVFIKNWITLHVIKVDSKLKDGKERDTIIGPMMANYLRNKV